MKRIIDFFSRILWGNGRPTTPSPPPRPQKKPPLQKVEVSEPIETPPTISKTETVQNEKDEKSMSKRIILIAGHHGPGTGANGFLDEGAENIRVRDDLHKKLIELRVSDENIITDKGRDNVVLRDIVSWLRNDVIREDDICIDIHFNAATATATGIETFVPNHPTANELNLAREVNNAMVAALGLRDRGVKWERESHVGTLAMLSFNCTTILLEICFVTNENDVRAYRENYDRLIDGLGNAIANHFFIS